MPQLQKLAKSKRSSKICVVGSTKHSSVISVEWENVASVNLADFDIVIANVETLTSKNWNFAFGWPVRTALSSLIASGGKLILLGCLCRQLPGKQGIDATNYCWCPINLATIDEKGDTVKPKEGADFVAKFASHVKSWSFYYDRLSPREALAASCKSDGDWPIRLVVKPLITNRYDGILAAAIEVEKFNRHRPTSETQRFGLIMLLPRIEDKGSRETVNLILEELCHLPQQTLPPDWVEEIVVPQTPDIRAAISQHRTEIEALNDKIAGLEGRVQELNEYRKLVYADGNELEEIFARCLQELGGTVAPAKYSQEEFILEHDGDLYLVECKGVGKSIALTHARQLTDYMLKFEEDEGKRGKGILLGNAWKELPLEQRGSESTVIFPPNVVSRATSFGIALVNSVDFLQAFMGFLDGEVDGGAILSRITGAAGVVEFGNAVNSAG